MADWAVEWEMSPNESGSRSLNGFTGLIVVGENMGFSICKIQRTEDLWMAKTADYIGLNNLRLLPKRNGRAL